MRFGSLKTRKFQILFSFLLFGTAHSFAQATDSEYLMTYKFTVEGVTTPEQAEAVVNVYTAQHYTAGVYFIDECDCFKIDVHQEVNYVDLKSPLLDLNLHLSPTLAASDGSMLNENEVDHETE